MRLGLSFRLLSVLVLLVYAVLVVLFIVLIIQNIFIALLIGTTSLVLAFAGWLMFTAPDKHPHKGRWLAVVAILALAGEIVYLFVDQRDRQMMFVLALLMVIYLVLFGILRNRYWTAHRHQRSLDGQTAHFSNPYLIINPMAGNGRATKANIALLAEQRGIHVLMTRKDKDVAACALEAVAAGADVIGVSGGDGSIGAVAKVAIDNDLPIVVLPGGTRCHFARDIGLDPKHIADALSGFSGIERRVDAGDINGRIFLNNASFGLYADIVDHPNYREHKVQITRQVLQAIASGAKQAYDIRIQHEDIHISRAVQVLIGVNRYNTVNLLELGHRQRLDEDILQVTAITELNDQLIKRLLLSVSMGQLIGSKEFPGIRQWVHSSLTVESESTDMVVGVDGEREVHQVPVEVRILPGALRIFVPAEGIRGRRRNPLRISTASKILRASLPK